MESIEEISAIDLYNQDCGEQSLLKRVKRATINEDFVDTLQAVDETERREKWNTRKKKKKTSPKQRKDGRGSLPQSQSSTASSSNGNSTDVNDEYAVDTFDLNKPIDIRTDICALCKEVC